MAPTAHAATARARTILGLSLAAALAAVHVSGDVVGYSEVLASAKYSESPTAVVEFLSPGEHPAIHLHYLPLRAAGDLIALMLEEGQMPYMATYHGKRRFHGKIKSEMPLGRVPVLEHHGLMLHQSSAIVRYLAPFVALDGGHDHEKALVDAMYAAGDRGMRRRAGTTHVRPACPVVRERALSVTPHPGCVARRDPGTRPCRSSLAGTTPSSSAARPCVRETSAVMTPAITTCASKIVSLIARL